MKLVYEIAMAPLTATIVAVTAVTAIAAIEINMLPGEVGKIPLAIAARTSLAFAAIRALTCSK